MPAKASDVRKYRRNLRRRAIALLGKECYFCGSRKRKDAHAAHVEPTGLNGAGRGMDRRFRDVIKNPEKYRRMCASCHRKFDALVSTLMKLARGEREEPIPF